MTSDLVFDCVGASADRYSAVPAMTLRLRISDPSDAKMAAIALLVPAAGGGVAGDRRSALPGQRVVPRQPGHDGRAAAVQEPQRTAHLGRHPGSAARRGGGEKGRVMVMKLVGAALVALVVAAIIASLPDIRRYREMRAM